MAIDSAKLLDYALDRFQEEKYTEALEAFILSYTKGYEREWVLENIYNCYMDGNEAEFQKCYEHWSTSKKPTYENLTLDFVPYREGEYYIYDKGIQNFRGIFSMDSVNHVTRQEDFRQMEFSALAVAMYWDWSSLPEILVEAGFHKIYAVCQDMNRCASFFKIPELAEYAKNIMLFPDMEAFQHYFREHTSEYLPKLCVGTEEGKKRLLDIINQEHEYRLTPEGRNMDNVLLTIGIPTYERGNLILQRLENLERMSYDSEIEFVISKNGTELYQEEYKSVSKIPDSRIKYRGYDETLTAWDNTKNVMRMASGKFVLIVSDEDDVIIPALEHYLHVLDAHDDLGMVRARTRVQYFRLDRTVYYEQGEDALFGGFLSQNYMSGAIYHRERFWKSGIEKWDEKYYPNNIFYAFYSHMWCQVLLSDIGDYMQDSVYLISEGDSAYEDMKKQYELQGKSSIAEAYKWEKNIPVYSTWESRMRQFRDALVVFRDFAGDDRELEIKMTLMMIYKTAGLMNMVRDQYTMEERLELTEEFLAEVKLELNKRGKEINNWGLEMTEDMKKNIETYLI